ncbi:MAG: VCBS repeat-containing protein [Candidatus Riflebacteria bacterium]|nr:VCBS repeat-containing protein [Candidatus Riflebacteria bacterium]
MSRPTLHWAVALMGVAYLGAPAWAGDPRSLQGVAVPTPPSLATFVRDQTAAIKLGKALFWDMQVGSDGVQACASCHYQAGADIRFKNQADPGLRASPSDTTFQKWGPNALMRKGDFPVTTNDIAGSQGCVNAIFADVVPGSAVDNWTPATDPSGFLVSSQNTRRVTARNTPPAVNAVFNFNNFWDGRAKNVFNGTTPGGPGAEAYLLFSNATGTLAQVTVAITNASAASQAVGPPLADEMSWAGRTWPDIGKKMLTLTPLAKQKVSPADSVLGALASADKGLTTSYTALIQQAFVPSWWNSADPAVVGGRTYTQMEANFPLFWGLAIQLYEATLVSDQTPFDTGALNAQQIRGLTLFNGKANCRQCHGGPLISDASDPNPATQMDNIGVRPVAEDIGAQAVFGSAFEGMFKIPGLRNVELTGPYFHNGQYESLEQVIDHYDRGGDFSNPGIRQIPLGLTVQEKADLKAFLLSLTDPRVRNESAPFDHPELLIPNGHPGNTTWLAGGPSGPGALDSLLTLPAVGAGGRASAGLPPLQPFLTGAKYTVAADFDQDQKSDLAIWRPSDGTWYTLHSSDRTASMRQWGATTDIPVSADYDGDGRSDRAVWRNFEGNWYVTRSSDGVATRRQWGTVTYTPHADVFHPIPRVPDIPVPADYDGDGEAELAVWRPESGIWYLLRSSDGGVTTVQWGTATLFPKWDVPVPGDYDGDGKADVAVWRPSDGTWYVLRSSDGVASAVQWGDLDDKPVPGDYDGDGRTDFAVFRPATGDWLVRRSSTGATTRNQWGAPTDVPIACDLDGDGRADCAVFRPSRGTWYVLRSSDGVQVQEPWGALTDVPVNQHLQDLERRAFLLPSDQPFPEPKGTNVP